MVILATIGTLCLVSTQKTVDKFTLDLFQDSFVVRTKLTVDRTPLRQPVIKPTPAVVFRKDNVYAVWDDRGLTVRDGARVMSSKLEEIAVSPKVNKREEIRETLTLIGKGERTKTVSALSGSKRVGTEAFFLARWDTKAGKPWLEVLVKVDLAAKKPRWQVVGKFDGVSTARKLIDDQLFLSKGQLAVVVRRNDDWGVASYIPNTNNFDFQQVGESLSAWSNKGFFVDKSSYGMTVGGTLDLTGPTRKILFESHGPAYFVDAESPLLAVIKTSSGLVLMNVNSGAQIPIQSSSEIRRVGKNVLVWNPHDAPKLARLYDPVRWQELARWQAQK